MPNDLVETFIFETSRFSPNNRIPNKKLEEEFTKYKNKMGIDITNTELDDNRKYLDKCSYVQKGTLYIQEEKFMYEGFYGLALKIDNQNIRKTISVTVTTSAVESTATYDTSIGSSVSPFKPDNWKKIIYYKHI